MVPRTTIQTRILSLSSQPSLASTSALARILPQTRSVATPAHCVWSRDLCSQHSYVQLAPTPNQCGEVFSTFSCLNTRGMPLFCTSSCTCRTAHTQASRSSVSKNLPFGSHPLVGGNVNGVCDSIVTHSQAQVCDGTHAVFLHQNVLGLQVSMSNSRFPWQK